MQVEHWSRTRDLDMRRALLHTADLLVRYPAPVVLPVMVLSDQPSAPPDDRFEVVVADHRVIDFRVWLVQVQQDLLVRWERHPSLNGAEGGAEAAIATILNLVRDGDLPRAKAELRLRHLAEQAVIVDAQLQIALRDLG